MKKKEFDEALKLLLNLFEDDSGDDKESRDEEDDKPKISKKQYKEQITNLLTDLSNSRKAEVLSELLIQLYLIEERTYFQMIEEMHEHWKIVECHR